MKNVAFKHEHIEVNVSKNKGLGIFATENIPTDTIILKEIPIFLKQNYKNNNKAIAKLIKKILKTYPKEFLALTPLTLKDNKPASKRFLFINKNYLPNLCVNAVRLHFKKIIFNAFSFNNRRCILLFLGSRFNHSCVPNVDYSKKKTDKHAVFKTTRIIEKGEELFISYADNELPDKERQERLQEGWEFICNCERCTV